MTETSLQKLLRTGKVTNIYKQNYEKEIAGDSPLSAANPQRGISQTAAGGQVRMEEAFLDAIQSGSGQPPAKVSAVPGKSGSSEVFRGTWPIPNPAESPTPSGTVEGVSVDVADEEEELEAIQAAYSAISGLVEKHFGRYYPTETKYCKAELRKMFDTVRS